MSPPVCPHVNKDREEEFQGLVVYFMGEIICALEPIGIFNHLFYNVFILDIVPHTAVISNN
jgi:hypothetical protein